MTGPHWFLIACFAVLAVGTRYLISQAFPREGAGGLAESRGDVPRAVLYSLISAMMPWKKETANRHIVSYALGITLHIGIFLSFLWLVLIFFNVELPQALIALSAIVLALGAFGGLLLLIRRLTTSQMRYLSTPDDYFSSLLTTGFIILTLMVLRSGGLKAALFIYAGILFLYIPVGKLRHAIYFALARVYLGLFYGRRDVWPADGRKSWRTRP